MKKLIKILNVDPKKEILHNTVGYIHALTERPVNLVTYADSTVVAYTVEVKNFLKIIKNSMQNYEYFMELKTKISQTKIIESF